MALIAHGCVPCHLEHQLLPAISILGPLAYIALWRVTSLRAAIGNWLRGRGGHVEGCSACEHSDDTMELLHGPMEKGYRTPLDPIPEANSIVIRKPKTTAFMDGVWANRDDV